MNRRRTISSLAFLLVLFAHDKIMCQVEDHLYPVSSPFSQPVSISSYFVNVNRVLMRGRRVLPIVQTVTLPSFEPEWAVYIQRAMPDSDEVDPETLPFEVVAVKANRQVWSTLHMSEQAKSAKPDDISISVCRKLIPAEHATEVMRAFFSMLSKTKYSDRPFEGLDGVTYHFGVLDVGRGLRLNGQAWSPSEGSKSRNLVELSEALFNYAQAETEQAASDALKIAISIASRLTK